jgi:hypothetical protein
MAGIPWYAKIAAKVVLSRIPASYELWRRLRIFAHGSMQHADYAYRVFEHHFGRSQFARKRGGYSALEIGPGDSLTSALIAAAQGASEVHLVDTGPYAETDPAVYQKAARWLQERGLAVPDLSDLTDIDSLLAKCNATYGTEGLSSLRAIPSASIDFCWSQAVLEHVRKHEIVDTMRELRRVMRADGVSSHVIDLKDHLGGALNNLRFPSRWWEADWMAKSGFYTNRLRMSEMLEIFRHAGFAVTVDAVRRWDSVPTPAHSMAPEFRSVPTSELLIQEFDVMLLPV